MTTCISLVRHGEVDNSLDVYYGRLPGFGLSDEGRRQAQAAAVYLAQRATSSMLPPPDSPQLPAAVWCSPLSRARQTARILADRLPGLDAAVSPELAEVYTPFDGQPRSAMQARGWDFYTGVEPPYEQPGDVVARLQRFFARVRAEYASEHVVAVTHGDLVTFGLLWAMGRPVDQAHKIEVAELWMEGDYPAPASISSLFFRTEDADELPRIEYVCPYA